MFNANMFSLKKYFVLNKLYKHIVIIKFIYYKFKHLIHITLQYCDNFNNGVYTNALYFQIKAIKY